MAEDQKQFLTFADVARDPFLATPIKSIAFGSMETTADKKINTRIQHGLRLLGAETLAAALFLKEENLTKPWKLGTSRFNQRRERALGAEAFSRFEAYLHRNNLEVGMLSHLMPEGRLPQELKELLEQAPTSPVETKKVATFTLAIPEGVIVSPEQLQQAFTEAVLAIAKPVATDPSLNQAALQSLPGQKHE